MNRFAALILAALLASCSPDDGTVDAGILSPVWDRDSGAELVPSAPDATDWLCATLEQRSAACGVEVACDPACSAGQARAILGCIELHFACEDFAACVVPCDG